MIFLNLKQQVIANQFIIKGTIGDMYGRVAKDLESLEGLEPEYVGVLLLESYKKEDAYQKKMCQPYK